MLTQARKKVFGKGEGHNSFDVLFADDLKVMKKVHLEKLQRRNSTKRLQTIL